MKVAEGILEKYSEFGGFDPEKFRPKFDHLDPGMAAETNGIHEHRIVA